MTQPTTQTREPSTPFIYQAQTLEGQAVSGTIDAGSVDQAQRLLTGLRLRVLNIETVSAQTRPLIPKPLRAEDFVAFNQQLAHLTSAGMPIEQGLRLIAQDMHSRRMAETVNALAAEMERGTPLQQALEAQQDRFPPLYGRLVGAGVASGNLPGMLLNLGRHLDLVERLRAALWRAAAYPIMVLIGLALVVGFISQVVLPQFYNIFKDFGTKLPALTEAIMQMPVIVPWVLLVIGAIIVLLVVTWLILKSAGLDRVVTERTVFHLPLIGPILRYNLLARWCDAAALSIKSGLDLPRAIALANDAVASPTLRQDSEQLIGALQAGNPLDSVRHTRLLPATAVATMSLASQQSDLGGAMTTLSEMYQQQSQLRLALLPAVLTPVLLVVMAVVIGAVIMAMFLPMISLIQNISSPMKK